MAVEKWKIGWLKGVVILFGMLGIFQLQTFFPGNGPGQKVIRVAIEIGAIAVLPVVLTLWPSSGEKRAPGMRWIIFFVLIVLGLPITDFWLIPLIWRHPSLEGPVSSFVLRAGDWLPVLVAVPIVAYSIWRQHRLHSGPGPS